MKPLFQETQRFRQWWLWGILLLTAFSAIIIPLFFAKEHELTLALSIGGGTMILTSLFLYMMRLETALKKDGIYYKFFPFHLGHKQISWDQLEEVSIKKYNALKEYGGWGIRYGLSGTAYNVQGNIGLHLTFKNGKKLLIGTQKAEELQRALQQTQFGLTS